MGQPILKSLGWRTTREQIDQPFKCLNFDKNKDTVFSLVVQVTVIRVQCTCIYIYIYLEEPLGFFFCPQRLGSRIGIFTRKFAKLGRFTYAFLSFFISKCFFVLRRHFAPRHFYPEVKAENPKSRWKKTEFGRILFETCFCTEQHEKTIQKIISLVFFLGLGIYSENRQKSKPTGRLGTFFCLEEFVCHIHISL